MLTKCVYSLILKLAQFKNTAQTETKQRTAKQNKKNNTRQFSVFGALSAALDSRMICDCDDDDSTQPFCDNRAKIDMRQCSFCKEEENRTATTIKLCDYLLLLFRQICST